MLRRYAQPAAQGETTRDSSGKTLYERYCERVLWLGQNNVHRAQEPVKTEAEKPLSEAEKKAAAAKAVVDGLRVEIDAATKGYSQYAKNQNARLHKKLNEVLADRNFKYRDRYPQVTLTGLE